MLVMLTLKKQGKGNWEEPSRCVLRRSCLRRVGLDIEMSTPIMSKRE